MWGEVFACFFFKRKTAYEIASCLVGSERCIRASSTGAATDKAEATRIVSDMRSMKTACVMYYADSGEWPEAINASFDKYLDVPVSDNDDYSLTTSENVLWLSYKGGKLAEGNGVSERLAAMAKETGLYASASAEPDDPDYSGGAEVFMIVKK